LRALAHAWTVTPETLVGSIDGDGK